MPSHMLKLHEHLEMIYGAETAVSALPRLQQLIETYKTKLPPPRPLQRTEKLAILITYGDQVQAPGEAPLRTLADFCKKHLAGVVPAIHVLPFYPYSSDDGFSVIDYKQVDPALGDWQDIAHLNGAFRLMFDAVINHISAKSDWFQRFLADDAEYRDYFTVVDPDTDLSQVFRPRALPLLTAVETAVGPKHVWTTFSDDQIDLNYANPDVLLDVLDTLLFYVQQGAEFIRLDAVAFMWKEIGTASIHLPQTHRLIQLMRSVLDAVAPHVQLITETNVPHQDNISYFGDGRNEAQMVYNFSLPPLTLHAFHTGSAEILSRWAETLTLPSKEVTFFNFLASHDGIGVTPARGYLSDAEVQAMADRVQALGGYVSYRSNPDGGQSAYELNINYLDALGNPAQSQEPAAQKARRFLAAQAIMLALRGVPGIYFHSLFGSQNWREGVAQTGRYRTINRQKLQRETLEVGLADETSLRHHVFSGYVRLLRQRAAVPAFHPNGDQHILHLHPAVFAVQRASPDGRSRVTCLHNVSNQPASLTLPAAGELVDLISGSKIVAKNGRLSPTLAPYQVMWLAPAW